MFFTNTEREKESISPTVMILELLRPPPPFSVFRRKTHARTAFPLLSLKPLPGYCRYCGGCFSCETKAVENSKSLTRTIRQGEKKNIQDHVTRTQRAMSRRIRNKETRVCLCVRLVQQLWPHHTSGVGDDFHRWNAMSSVRKWRVKLWGWKTRDRALRRKGDADGRRAGLSDGSPFFLTSTDAMETSKGG